MNVHDRNAGAWGLCWILVALIASIPNSMSARVDARLLIRPGDDHGLSFPELVASSDADSDVRMYADRFLTLGRHETELILGRAEVYFPEIETSLEQAGLPNALKYLPMVESTLLPEVVSPAGAAGIWQLMPATARFFGLTVDAEVDERLDPRLAGKAATELLQMLHRDFDDWFLVLAAYNCGPGRVRKAIAKTGSRDYAVLKTALPRQTRNYISKFLAMAYVANTYAQHNLQPRKASVPATIREAVHMEESVDFTTLAKRLGIPAEELRRLNPAYRTAQLPERPEGWMVFIPGHLAGKLKVVSADADAHAAAQSGKMRRASGWQIHSSALMGFSLFPKLGFQQDRTHNRRAFGGIFSKYFLRRTSLV